PGRAARGRVTVRPASWQWFGPASESYSFEVRALPGDGAEIRVPGTMRQAAILPRGTLTIAVVAALLLRVVALLPQIGPGLVIGRVGRVSPPSPAPSATPSVAPSVSPSPDAQPSSSPSPTAQPSASASPVRPGAWSAATPMAAARALETAT